MQSSQQQRPAAAAAAEAAERHFEEGEFLLKDGVDHDEPDGQRHRHQQLRQRVVGVVLTASSVRPDQLGPHGPGFESRQHIISQAAATQGAAQAGQEQASDRIRVRNFIK